MKSIQKVFLSVSFLTLLVAAPICENTFASEEMAINISLPAEILYEIISDALPIPLEGNQELVDGNITIVSLDKLQVKDNSIVLQGVVKGENLSVNTSIAGRDLNMKLGTAILPVTCELLMRFDKIRKILYLTPRFSKPDKAGGGTELGDVLLPVLTAFADREHPVEFDAIKSLLVKVGSRNIPINLGLVDIQAKQGMMIIKLRPEVSKTQ
ncbi:MAG: hypothetical protein ACSLFC_14760 [Desulfuromonadales bacterium]